MAKRRQPETSLEALEEKSTESTNNDKNRILMALRHLGSGNYDDIAKFLQVQDANVVSRRMKEMREQGLIENTGIKTKTRRDRKSYVHQITGSSQPKTTLEVFNERKRELKKNPLKHKLLSTQPKGEENQPKKPIWEQQNLL